MTRRFPQPSSGARFRRSPCHIAVLTALNLAYQRAEHALVAPQPVSGEAVAMSAETGTLDVDHLIRRIDQALGDDGQLL